jgi:hypothetical protein
MISLLILSVIASGSVFSILSDFYGISIDGSNALSLDQVDWFKFLVNTSLYFGFPATILCSIFGPKITFIVGAALLLLS